VAQRPLGPPLRTVTSPWDLPCNTTLCCVVFQSLGTQVGTQDWNTSPTAGDADLVARAASLCATPPAGDPTAAAGRLAAPAGVPAQPQPWSGTPPAALQHQEASPSNTRRSHPHSPAFLEQVARRLEHPETSFQQGARSLEQDASLLEHQTASLQQAARSFQQVARPLEHLERLRVVAARSRVVARTPANVAIRLREGPASAAAGAARGAAPQVNPVLTAH
jgi:hypothetical protein